MDVFFGFFCASVFLKDWTDELIISHLVLKHEVCQTISYWARSVDCQKTKGNSCTCQTLNWEKRLLSAYDGTGHSFFPNLFASLFGSWIREVLLTRTLMQALQEHT